MSAVENASNVQAAQGGNSGQNDHPLDLEVAHRLLLRAPPLTDGPGGMPRTLAILLDELVTLDPVARPVALGQALAEVARQDPAAIGLLRGLDVAPMLRAEVMRRKAGAYAQSKALVVPAPQDPAQLERAATDPQEQR